MFSSTRTRPSSTPCVAFTAIAAATSLALALPAWTQRGPQVPRGHPNPSPQASTLTGLATHDLASGGQTPASLVAALVGPGAVVSNIQYSGAPIGAGTFEGGTGSIGFEQGVILCSGSIANVVGSVNTGDFDSVQTGTPGDPDLDTLVDESWGLTNNAAVLEFDLESPTATQVSFQYVFASEEYDELPSVDDVFGCFVNGQNIALIPGTNSHVGAMVVNCGREWSPPGENCAFYRTNDCGTLGLGFPCSNIATQVDGLTVVLTGTGTLQPGLNHVKLAVADQGDQWVDSYVFLRGGSFVASSGAPVFETPSSCDQILNGWVGTPFGFDVTAWATNGLPGAAVTLDVTGDAVPLSGGSFTPTLPTSPAQPGSTHFDWSPTLADVGLYHLLFTATDQLQQSASLDVTLQISTPAAPVFNVPSPCGQTLDAIVGAPFDFVINASAWTIGCQSTPGQSVVLSVTGDNTPLAGGVFDPPLPAGPSQPVSTQFHWTPTVADVGLYHIEFTATDELQHSATCSVDIRVSLPDPVFLSPSPCGQTRNAFAELPFQFDVRAAATNGDPGQSVTLDVTGDAIPLAGGTFVPPLPAGPAQPVSTQFQWTPTLADVGLYHLTFTATDQVQQSTSCDVTIRVFGSPGIDVCQAGVDLVIPCPCGNPPAFSPGGCDNSAGTGGARLGSIGNADPDFCTVVFTTTGETPTALSLVIQGNAFLPAGAIYGQGVRCAGGQLKRLYVKTASGGSITAPEAGDRNVADRSCYELHDCMQNGTTRYYAVYYRDPTILGGCPPVATFNITQTQEIVWHY